MSDSGKAYWEGVIPTMMDPADVVEWEQEPEAREPVTGWLLPPIVSSIWAAVFTKQSSNPLFDIAYRAKAVYELLRTFWNDFCLWSKERRDPWAAWSCQVGYAEPSGNPTWRMKYTIEIRTWANMNTVFHVNTTNAKWYV